MVIESRKNAKIKHVKKLLRDKSYRRTCGEFVAEGPKIIFEALSSGFEPEGVFVSRTQLEKNAGLLGALSNHVPVYEADEAVFCEISDVITPQGILAIFKTDVVFTHRGFRGHRLLALEDIRDPGNLGTIIRTADAFSIDSLVLLSNTAEVTSPKVLRSTMGSIFRVNCFYADTDAFFAYCKANRVPLYGAALRREAVLLSDAALKDAAVIIGNESRGLSEGICARCEHFIEIPMPGQIESLNAAVSAAIFMWEMQKNRETG